MKRIRLYKVNIDYIKYLYSFEKRVKYDENKSNEYTQKRPYIGIVLNIGDFDYFAPLESPKPNHKNMKNNVHIMKINDGRDGLIAFGDMIPIKSSELINFDINKEEIFYKNLLIRQLIFCNNNNSRIQQHAIDTYTKVAIKESKFFKKICCNFKLLEEKCLEYQYYLESAGEVAAAKDDKVDIEKERKIEDDWEMER